MTEGATTARGAAIEDFAASLRRLRESAGTPSFREMSGRSRAISHTTLHEAAQGNRLPSWPTTVEFVKACGADPADYRQQWDAANCAVRTTEPSSVGDASVGNAVVGGGVVGGGVVGDAVVGGGVVSDADGSDADGSDADGSDADGSDADVDGADVEELTLDRAPRAGSRRRRVLQGVAAAGVVAAATVTVVVASGGDGRGTTPPNRTSLVAANCPIHLRNPPPAPPTTPGDSGVFVVDLTLPDCSHVRTGQTVAKVWRLKNRGSVAWRGYELRRMEVPQRRDQCQTISDVPIDDTMPGAFVDVRTEITTPKAPTFCFVRFAVVDSAGRVAFPGGRPLNFQLVVDRPS